MAEYIKREDAISACISSNAEQWMKVVNAINLIPSAKVRENVVGEWTGKGAIDGFGIFICSACGKFAISETDFCPNCGADMRGEKE